MNNTYDTDKKENTILRNQNSKAINDLLLTKVLTDNVKKTLQPTISSLSMFMLLEVFDEVLKNGK